MTVISISLSPDLLERLDEFVERSGYSSRSEAIRLAVRDVLSNFALQRLERGEVLSTVTALMEKERQEVNSQLMDLRHLFDENISFNMHFHVGGTRCVEVFLVQGLLETVLDFISRVRATRGIGDVRYTLTNIQQYMEK
ncbi:MAG TPA: CopG family ribbon-helix-helix protein [Patescibacteria group bacterium]|nr:CopG family ribbon-helix-helix protein [Patescibacteria group bacterium]